MVTCSKIFHMIPNIIIITIFLLLSLQCTHTLATDDASLDAPECLKVHGLQKLHSFEEVSENGDGNQVKKVAGEDENEEKEALIVQKFRALLGLRSSKSRRPSTEYVSPAPSPSPLIEAEPPSSAPAPVLPVHGLHHPPLHHSYRAPQLHKIQKEHTNKSRFRRIIVAVLASIGAAFLVCVVGLFWVTGKFSKSKAKPAKTMSMYKKKGRSRGKSSKHLSSSQKSASKINLNPGLDLLYLSSVGRDLEQQSISLKQAPETANTSSSNHCTPKFALLDREERPNQSELMNKPEESDNASSSSTREITSVHEDVESVRFDSDGGGRSSSGDKIIPIECHSSDDESFHSFVDSHSSLVRLSNASAASLSDTSEIPHANVSKGSPSPSSPSKYVGSSQATSSRVSTPELNVHPEFLPSPSNCKEDILAVAYLPNPDTKNVPPPPPPPPALSQSVHCHFPSLHTSSLSSVITSKASDSSTLSTSSSPRKLNSSSGYNQSPQSNLPSSPQKSPKPLSSSPQKSPKVLQGSPSIPPPPCPPPLMKGSSSSVKVPPPPPMGLPQYTPMGKDGAPLAKLKPLHWDKVRAAPDRSMVWDKIRSSSFELDEEMIESLFGYNLRTAARNDEAKSKTPSPSKHVLEPKRLQNITILSKAINATVEQVCDALIRGDGLGLQQLEALAKMVPTKEEEAKLSGYNGDINELGSAEKFVIVVLRIPFAFLRVEAMLYRETFEDEVVHLRTSFSMLEEACKELRSSRLFLKLLEAVLKTGNRMNVGTIRGGARAFKLDALLKLSDVKGTDGRTTLLHFVVQEIMRSEGIRVSDSIMGKIDQKNRSQTAEEKEEDYKRMGLNLVSGLSTELYNVKKTATIDLDVLASSVSNLSEGISKLQHLVIKELYADEKSESFVDSMKKFMRYAEQNLKELREDEDRVLLHVREITEYFHGDVSKDEANPLRIFVIVRDFLGMLDHVCKELRNLKVPSSPNPLAPFR